MGLSLRALAEGAGMDAGNLSKLENGKTGYGQASIERIAEILHVSVGVLFADTDVVEAAALSMRPVPILTPKQLAMWRGPDGTDFEIEPECVHIEMERVSRYVFALRVEDDSNVPDLLLGDLVIFDAKKQPRRGIVVAGQDDAGAIYLGRFRSLAAVGNTPLFEIIPRDPVYGAASPVTTKGLAIRGTSVEIRRPVV
jgi:transcriptional regulator with XRE-family HTH domain